MMEKMIAYNLKDVYNPIEDTGWAGIIEDWTIHGEMFPPRWATLAFSHREVSEVQTPIYKSLYEVTLNTAWNKKSRKLFNHWAKNYHPVQLTAYGRSGKALYFGRVLHVMKEELIRDSKKIEVIFLEIEEITPLEYCEAIEEYK